MIRVQGLPQHVGWALTQRRVSPNDLHPAEQAVLRSSAGEKRRCDFYRGRWAAHQALAKLGLDVDVIGQGPRGEPSWPVGVAGSITHGADLAFAVVSEQEWTDGIGIDIERLRPSPELDAHVPRPEETAWLDRLDPHSRERELVALFSAKESIFKAFYPRVRRSFGFDAACLVRTPNGYTARFAKEVDEEYPTDRSFDVCSELHDDVVVSWLILPKGPTSPSTSHIPGNVAEPVDQATAAARTRADFIASAG